MKKLAIFLGLLIFLSCVEKERDITAQIVIDKAIDVSCHGNCGQATIDFVFRGRQYIGMRNDGNYQYERITTDTTGITRDVLTNTHFKRYFNESLITVADTMAFKYSNSINGVLYFAQLPYGLNDSAVRKKLIGEEMINGEPYYEVEIYFSEEKGGKDFEDVFMYWIHQNNYTVDYLAYSYLTDGGGIRFREAYNPRIVNGIRFVDYNNFKPESLDTPLEELDKLFVEGKLKLLSVIETEDINVILH